MIGSWTGPLSRLPGITGEDINNAACGREGDDLDGKILLLKPQKDTYVEFDNKDKVFSDSSELKVDIGRSAAYISFSVPLGGQYIKSARLKLHLNATSKTKNARICVYALKDYEWDEKNFNWNLSGVNSGEWVNTFDVYYKCGENCDYSVDVTDAFRGVKGNAKMTFRIDSETYLKDQYTIFASLESGENSPVLIVKLDEEKSVFNEPLTGEDGHELWLRYLPKSGRYRKSYGALFRYITLDMESQFESAVKYELNLAISKMFGFKPVFMKPPDGIGGGILVKTDQSMETESFVLKSVNGEIEVKGNGAGILYGIFRLLELVQREKRLEDIEIFEKPYFRRRMLNNWEDFDQTVERGYAGGGIWRWHELPERMSPVYRDYARISASLGINSIIINNVNPDTAFLSDEIILKIARLADLFREYGVRLYVAAHFDAPTIMGGFSASDPEAPEVIAFWKDRTEKFYSLIPDFGGYCIKGDSEGQPGPMKYGKDHSVGANMFADILGPYKGEVLWRAFVYRIPGLSDDRACQAYEVFKPLDGKFKDNVILQTKNGPMDFQVYEPVSPIFGALKKTKAGLELQAILEYKGQTTHICYVPFEFKQILMHETGSGIIADICREQIISPVNIGTDRNWTRHPLAAANLYGFGRLAFDPFAGPEEITEEWIERTFSNERKVVETIKSMLLESYNIYASYTSPLGLGYMCDKGSHFNPEPEIRGNYNGSDTTGLGYDRTSKGSGFIDQYHKSLRDLYNDPHSIPQEKLLWIHHLPFDFRIKDGLTLIQAVYNSYFDGACKVEGLIDRWNSLKTSIDPLRFSKVSSLLSGQLEEAYKWRNNSLMFLHNLSRIDDEANRALGPETGSIHIEEGIAGDSIKIATDYKYATIYVIKADYAITPRYAKKSELDMIADGLDGICATVYGGSEAVEVKKPVNKGVYNIFVLDRNKFFNDCGKCEFV